MNATRLLHERGQSLWLDNITRGLLTNGTLGRYIATSTLRGDRAHLEPDDLRAGDRQVRLLR